MTRIRGMALAGAALALSSLAVEAADHRGGPRTMQDYGHAPVTAASGSLYLRLDGGFATHDRPSLLENGIFQLTNASLDDTWTIGAGVGSYFTRNVRGDITVDHRFETDISGRNSDPASAIAGARRFGLESTVVLANIYYDFDTRGRFTPYVGAGLGFARNSAKSGTLSTDCGCTGTVGGGDTWNAAGVLMAGFSLGLTPRQAIAGSTKDGMVHADASRGLTLDAGYRFLHLGDAHTGLVQTTGGVPQGTIRIEDLNAHEFRLGLRYDLR